MADKKSEGLVAIGKYYEGNSPNWKTAWGKLFDGRKIFIVDGAYVRANYFVDYVEGGHGYVYDWMPKDEIWIERMGDPIDQAINLSHEIFESCYMKDLKWSYDKAHDAAAQVEQIVRQAMAGDKKLAGKKDFPTDPGA